MRAIWLNRAIQRLRDEALKDQNVVHAWAQVWDVRCDPAIEGRDWGIFNPKYNLNSASSDAIEALRRIAAANIVHATRIRFCHVPMRLVTPMRLDVTCINLAEVPHCTLCSSCKLRLHSLHEVMLHEQVSVESPRSTIPWKRLTPTPMPSMKKFKIP